MADVDYLIKQIEQHAEETYQYFKEYELKTLTKRKKPSVSSPPAPSEIQTARQAAVAAGIESEPALPLQATTTQGAETTTPAASSSASTSEKHKKAEITPQDFRYIKNSDTSNNYGRALAYKAAWISGFLDITVTSLNQLIQRESKTISATDPTSELSNKTGAFATQLGFLGGWGFLWTNAFNGFRKLFMGQGKEKRAYKVAHDLGIFGILIGANTLFVLGISGFTVASGLCIAFVILPWVGVLINLMLILRGILRMKRAYEGLTPLKLLAQLDEKWKLALEITPSYHYSEKIKLHRVTKYEINTQLLSNLLWFCDMLVEPKNTMIPEPKEPQEPQEQPKAPIKKDLAAIKKDLAAVEKKYKKIDYAKLTKFIAREFDDPTDISYRNYRYFLDVVTRCQAHIKNFKLQALSIDKLLETLPINELLSTLSISELLTDDILKHEYDRLKKRNASLSTDELNKCFVTHLNNLNHKATAYAFNLITAQEGKYDIRKKYFVLGTICSVTFIALSIIGFLLTTNIAGISLFAFSALTLAILKIASGALAISVLACMGGFSFLSIKSSVDDYSKWKTASKRNKIKLDKSIEILLKLKCLEGEEITISSTSTEEEKKKQGIQKEFDELRLRRDNTQVQTNTSRAKEQLQKLLSYDILLSSEDTPEEHNLLSKELWKKLQDKNSTLAPIPSLLKHLKSLCEAEIELYTKKDELFNVRRDATILKSVGTGVFLVSSFLIVTAPLLSAATLLPLAVIASVFIAIGIALFIRGAMHANQIRILEKTIEAEPFSGITDNEKEPLFTKKPPKFQASISPSPQPINNVTPLPTEQLIAASQQQTTAASQPQQKIDPDKLGLREKVWNEKKLTPSLFFQTQQTPTENLASSSSSQSIGDDTPVTPPSSPSHTPAGEETPRQGAPQVSSTLLPVAETPPPPTLGRSPTTATV
ncbi:MAG: hypothetical protein A3B69_02275 [Gammaproteobacteria bacterium RIFCSPHIGHO2_02_FULL_38_33]|nr:MAG: hypothetical protein A3B69_02275 [Gammaproteobacteria bacterium RIFCSPHIGHO2_02_FULL_38_33]